MTERRALVTGASSGIGAAVAELLAQSGYRVALLARRAEVLQAIEAQLPGDGHIALPCDLRDPAAVEATFAALEEHWGALDLLVNNAGIGYRARIEELDPALLDDLLRTNVVAPLLCCKAASPLLRAGRAPHVINISSVVGRRGIPGQAAYSASKAAVCSIGEALRVEWRAAGIEVSTLNPALTATGFFEAQANPAGLEQPDLASATSSQAVAQAVLALDRSPQPERSLRWKWKLLGVLSVLAPRWADKLLAARLGGEWD